MDDVIKGFVFDNGLGGMDADEIDVALISVIDERVLDEG